MQVAPAQLQSHLQRGLKPLYVVHGDEVLLVQEAADAIRDVARAAGYTEQTVHTVVGAHFDWSAVLASGSSLSLFADRQIVEIRVPSGKPGKDGSFALQQVAELSQGNDSTLTLVVLPRLDKATQASAWFAALESFGITIRIEPVERAQLPGWIASRLQVQGLKVLPGVSGQRTLQFFADRVEGNLLAADQEIRKLALLYPTEAGSARELSFDEVESAVLSVARYNVFKLTEAMLGGQVSRFQRMLEGLQAEGEAAVLVHWALAEDIRGLKRVKDAVKAGRPLPMALREFRIWGVKEKLYERILPRLADTTLANWLHAAHVTDGIVKGLRQPDWPQDPWDALQRLGMLVTQETKIGS